MLNALRQSKISHALLRDRKAIAPCAQRLTAIKDIARELLIVDVANVVCSTPYGNQRYRTFSSINGAKQVRVLNALRQSKVSHTPNGESMSFARGAQRLTAIKGIAQRIQGSRASGLNVRCSTPYGNQRYRTQAGICCLAWVLVLNALRQSKVSHTNEEHLAILRRGAQRLTAIKGIALWI